MFYAGDNDLAAGKTPEQVFEDFANSWPRCARACPKTPIIFISIKPSLARWKLIDQGREANTLDRGTGGKDDPLIDVRRR